MPNLSSLLQFTSEQATPRHHQIIVKRRAAITGVWFFCPLFHYKIRRAMVSPVMVIVLPPRNANKGCVPAGGEIEGLEGGRRAKAPRQALKMLT